MYFPVRQIFFLVLAFNICGGMNIHKAKFPGLSNYKYVYDPDIDRNTSELISSKGFPVEEHTVQTKDGFILSLIRIPAGRLESGKNEKKQAVLMLHGLLSSSDQFVLNFPNQSLGFILADRGYDVWLGNTRGNTYSRRHVKYSPNDFKFWDYSFDEMGQYDLPAMIDYVLAVTGQDKLFYIGHSQGTTEAFALLSESQKYNDKIKLFVALAPVITAGHVGSPLADIAPFSPELNAVFHIFGMHKFPLSGHLTKYISENICESKAKKICEDLAFQIFGSDEKQLNESRQSVYLAHFFAGSSTKSVNHFAQLANSNRFQKYDHGIFNYLHYGQRLPPAYDVSLITAPVALMWSSNDKMADPTDVHALQKKLRSLVTSYEVPYPSFTHIDFAIALDAKTLVYDEILKLLQSSEH